MPSPTDIEAEFDRFVAATIPMALQPEVGRRRGPQPSISAEAIYEHALVLLDAEGARALTVRRLAADLKISTRTLYKRIGKRDNLIRNVVQLHFSKLGLGLREYDCWESTALNWCIALHKTLLAHPHLTDLMTDDDINHLLGYVQEIIKVIVQEGIPPRIAAECCRSLVHLTIADAIMEIRASCGLSRAPQTAVKASTIARNFPGTVGWILAGTRAMSSLQPTC